MSDNIEPIHIEFSLNGYHPLIKREQIWIYSILFMATWKRKSIGFLKKENTHWRFKFNVFNV